MARKKEVYVKSLLKSFFAVCGLILLVVVYRFVIILLEGGNIHRPFEILRALLAFSREQRELHFLLFAASLSFVLINFFPKKINKILFALCFFPISLWVLFRIFDLIHIYYAGTHIGKDFLFHIEKSSLSMAVNMKSVLLFIVIPVTVIFFVFLLLKKLDFTRYPVKLRIIALLILSLIFYGSIFLIKHDGKSLATRISMSKLNYHHPNAVRLPERFFLTSLRGEATQTGNTAPGISASTRDKLKLLFGVSINENEQLPLLRKRVYQTPLPYPKLHAGASLPNIIIFAMESLSSDLLGYNGVPFKGISPYIDEFARESLVIKPFYNSTTPTINGLVSILCSHYPVSGHEDWIDKNGGMKFDLLCLPEVLKKRGYHTYNIVPGDPYFALQLPFMKANGMDEVLGGMEIKKILKEKPLGSVFEGEAYSDCQVMRFLTERLKDKYFQEPFLIVVSTNDLHPPFKPSKDYIKYPGSENPILHLVHSADAALGEFWKHHKNNPLSSNTVIVLTADHSLFPGVGYKKIMNNNDIGYYDEIPFIIHDPTRKLPKEIITPSSSVDIAPSILHLLEINIPNPFEGISVFDMQGDTKRKGLLGSHNYLFFYRLNDRNFFPDQDHEKCNDKYEDRAGAFTECDYLSWWKYKKWLVKNDLIWKEKIVMDVAK